MDGAGGQVIDGGQSFDLLLPLILLLQKIAKPMREAAIIKPLKGKNGAYMLNKPPGQIKIKGSYNNDRMHGKWLFYEKNGNLKKEIEFINGKAIDDEGYFNEQLEKDLDEYEKNKSKFREPQIQDY